MSILHIVLIFICVLAISAGQILFKRAGIELEAAGSWINFRVMLFSGISVLIYFAATVLWIYLLRILSLSQAYPFMAISFILVPVLSFIFFGDKVHVVQMAGFALIASGVILASRFS